ncbi:alanine dehydrogenase [Thalassospira xiamenensis]|uniref:Alanine dehydrogenase n=1 Tax=Thalassospira xiamenensis TaxID=220697 RepID=A0A367WXG5_9PROT|nr:alanine dehydrogenase [Thalassospira xiamenensis]KZB53743.1 alanine dehydrogenase [Thalassospira xiamenensis]RCK45919.1 alanine dehydrogenase [Thalassospira xiamenensis]
MLIGIPKEIKNHEYRVGLTPSSVREVTAHGHDVIIETNAGAGIGCSNDDYLAAGAKIVDTAAEIFAKSEMVVKVKEPQKVEYEQLREGQLLFTYLHLAPDPEQTAGLVKSGVTAIAYETVTDKNGGLPLLAPMSEVAGRMAPQVGAAALQKANGGRGMLLGGVPGVAPAKVVVIGGGVVGTNAARIAAGMGADVIILDKNVKRLTQIDDLFGPRIKTQYATIDDTEALVYDADMVVGAVLIPGAAAPKLIHKDQLSRMKPGSVIVDVAIDQGGCFETSKATTHADPTYIVDDVVHYCVANMPGAVARTSTFALNNATLPFTLALADKGWKKACQEDPHLAAGLNVHEGRITYEAVARDLGYDYIPLQKVLN